MNLENDIRGQLEYEQFVFAQTVLALCKGKPCPYTFILCDECLMLIPLPYSVEEGLPVLYEHTKLLLWLQLNWHNMQSPILINNQMTKDL